MTGWPTSERLRAASFTVILQRASSNTWVRMRINSIPSSNTKICYWTQVNVYKKYTLQCECETCNKTGKEPHVAARELRDGHPCCMIFIILQYTTQNQITLRYISLCNTILYYSVIEVHLGLGTAHLLRRGWYRRELISCQKIILPHLDTLPQCIGTTLLHLKILLHPTNFS